MKHKPIILLPGSIERFWRYVDRRGPDECWEWQGGRHGRGYGHFHGGSKRDGTAGNLIASRVSYILYHGEIPAGRDICHRCDNPPCVNPSHLFAGTMSDNINDAVRKGRWTQPKNYRFCAHGHEFTVENTYHLRGLKYCRACSRERARRYYHQRKAS